MTTAQPLSKTYQVDFDWAYDHYADFVRRFPNRWVAVANQRIVAVSKEPLRALRLGQKKSRREQIPLIFVERGVHVYACSVGL